MKIKQKQKHSFDCSQKIDDVYENVKDYNPTKERRVLIEFHDKITDTESNKY